jgi:hypothetical protein
MASSQESLPVAPEEAMEDEENDSIRAEDSTTEDLLQSLQEPPSASLPVDNNLNKKIKLKRDSFSQGSPAASATAPVATVTVPKKEESIPLPSIEPSPIATSPPSDIPSAIPSVDVSGTTATRVSLKDLSSRKRKLDSDPPSPKDATDTTVLQHKNRTAEDWITLGKEYKSLANTFSSRVKREDASVDKKMQAMALLASTLCYFSTLPLKEDSLESFYSFYSSCASMTEASLSILGKVGLGSLRTLLCLLDIVLAAKAGEALAAKARHLKGKIDKLVVKSENSQADSTEEMERLKGYLEKAHAGGLSLWETVAKRSREAHEQCPQFHGKFISCLEINLKSKYKRNIPVGPWH